MPASTAIEAAIRAAVQNISFLRPMRSTRKMAMTDATKYSVPLPQESKRAVLSSGTMDLKTVVA